MEQKTEFKLAAGTVASTVVVVLVCLAAAATAVIEAGIVAHGSLIYAGLAALIAVAGVLRSLGLADKYLSKRTELKVARLPAEKEAARATSLRTALSMSRQPPKGGDNG